jgi:ABC-2 type transport system permease protein
MADALHLYFRLIQIAFKSRLQYRVDFLTGIIGVIMLNFVTLGSIGILASRFTTINGWTLWQLVFLYCLWLMGHSFFSQFFYHIRTLEDYLVQGTFDQFLIRPASVFVLFLGREVQYTGVADLGFAITGSLLAYSNLGLAWDWGKWLFFGLAIISGTLIEMTLNLMVSCLAFWTGRSRRATSLTMQISAMIQQYPVDIYGSVFRVIVTGLIPVAFMNYYPALLLLNKIDHQNPWWWLSYMSPVVALLMIGLSASLWNFALHHYSSSGG